MSRGIRSLDKVVPRRSSWRKLPEFLGTGLEISRGFAVALQGLRKFPAATPLLRLTLITRKNSLAIPSPRCSRRFVSGETTGYKYPRYHRGIKRRVHCEIAAVEVRVPLSHGP